MAKRKVQMLSANDKRAVVYYESEVEEYSVTFFRGAVKQTNAEYFACDKDDAIATAQHFVNFE